MSSSRPGTARLAEQLSAARRRRGLSVRALATACGLPASTIQGWLSGAHLPGPALRREFTVLLDALGLTEERPAQQWWADVSRARPAARPAAVPYVGLRSYRAEDDEHFFGRAAEIAELGRRVRSLAGAEGPRILAVVGASGAGKSSLLGAGLLGRLREEGGPLQGWSAVTTTPGLHPGERLDRALAADPALLVVDQLEELWTGSRDPEEPARFLARLAAASRTRVVVAGLRADFFGTAGRHPELRAALERPVLVGALSREQLRQIVVGPAEAVGARVSPDLVEVVLRDVAPRGTEAGVGLLPLLSQALLGTWEHASSRELGVADYHAAGGITEAVDRRAEEVYAGLGPQEQDVARAVLLRMVRVVGTGSSATVVRTPVRWEELPEGGPEVVEHFARARLLTADRDEVQLGHESLLDHWTRLRDWIEDGRRDLYVRQQLQRATQMWLANDRDPLALIPLAQLASFRDWTGDSRQQALLSPAEREYLRESERHYDDALERERLRTRQIKARGRVASVLLAVAVVAAVVAAGLGIRAEQFQAVAETARDEALSRQTALEAARIREETPNLAAQLGLAAHSLAATVEGRSALLDATAVTFPQRRLGPDGGARLAALPGGEVTARIGAEGLLSVWRGAAAGLAQQEDLVVAEDRQLFDVDVQRVGDRVLLLVVGDGHASLWEATGPTTTRLTDLPGIGTETLYAARIDAQAREAWIGGERGLYRYSVADPADPDPLPAPEVGDVVVSSITRKEAGVVHVAGPEQGILRFRVAGERIEELPRLETDRRAQSLAISPDGTELAAGLAERSVARFDLADDARPLEPLTGFGSWVNDVSWSADGTHLAVADSDQSAYLFREGELADVFPTPAAVTGAELVGNRLLSVSVDGEARSWPLDQPDFYSRGEPLYQLSTGRQTSVLSVVGIPHEGSGVISLFDISGDAPQQLPGPPAPEGVPLWYAGAVSPAGDFLVGGGEDGTVVVWPLSAEGAAGPPRTAEAVADGITGADVRADGELIAVWSEVGSEVALVRRAPDGSIETVGSVPAEHPQSVRFGPDGRLLAVADAGERSGVRLWNVEDGASPRHVVDLATPALTTAVAFAPDGATLAAGGIEGHLRLWSLEGDRAPRHLATRQDALSILRGMHFSPDGTAVAAASGDGYVWTWSVDGGRVRVEAALAAAGSRPTDVRFLGTEVLLATADDGSVRRWLVDPAAAREHICANRGDPITEDEWRRHVAGAPYRQLC